MCGPCLQDQVDITEDIPKKGLTVMQVIYGALISIIVMHLCHLHSGAAY